MVLIDGLNQLSLDHLMENQS